MKVGCMFDRNYYSIIALVIFVFVFLLSGCPNDLTSDNAYALVQLDVNYDRGSRSIYSDADQPDLSELSIYLTATSKIPGSYCSVRSDEPIQPGSIIKLLPGTWDFAVQLKDGNTVYYEGILNNCFINNTLSFIEIPVHVYSSGFGNLSFNITTSSEVSAWKVTYRALGSDVETNVINSGSLSDFTAYIPNLSSGDYIIVASVYNRTDINSATDSGGCICQARVIDGQTTVVSGEVNIDDLNNIAVSTESTLNGYISLINGTVEDGDEVFFRWTDCGDLQSTRQIWSVSRKLINDDSSSEILYSGEVTDNRIYSFTFESGYIYEVECRAESSAENVSNGYSKIILMDMDSVLDMISDMELLLTDMTDSVRSSTELIRQYMDSMYSLYPVVTFHPNGGVGARYIQCLKKGVASALLSNRFTAQPGLIFAGWNTDSNGGGISYTEEEVVTFTEATDLYAQWDGVSLGSRVLLSVSDIESENGHIILLNNSVKDGENVDLKWIDAGDSLSDCQYWNVNRRQIGSDGASEVISDNVCVNNCIFSFVYDSDYLYEIECKAGFNSRDINNGYGKIVILSMQSVLSRLSSLELIIDSMGNENDFLNEYIRQMIELELPRELTVTTGSHGDKITVSQSLVGKYDQVLNISAEVDPGYYFSGWTATDGIIADPASPNTTVTMPYSDVVVTANAEPMTFTVSFDSNQTEGSTEWLTDSVPTSVEDISVTFDSPYGTLPSPSRTGWSFQGWFTDTSGDDRIYEDTIVEILEDQTLYAHWAAVSYTITLVGASSGVDSQWTGSSR